MICSPYVVSGHIGLDENWVFLYSLYEIILWSLEYGNSVVCSCAIVTNLWCYWCLYIPTVTMWYQVWQSKFTSTTNPVQHFYFVLWAFSCNLHWMLYADAMFADFSLYWSSQGYRVQLAYSALDQSFWKFVCVLIWLVGIVQIGMACSLWATTWILKCHTVHTSCKQHVSLLISHVKRELAVPCYPLGNSMEFRNYLAR